MNFKRIIARLDIKGPNLVKGIHMEGLRVLGQPNTFAHRYFIDGADELFYQDVVASLYDRNSILELITKTAKTISIPLTVGGGIRSIDDINKVLQSGADKVAINTAAVKNPNLIKVASRIFGSSTIVSAVEVSKNIDNKYLVYTDNGREFTGIDAIEWCKKIEDLGSGEILLTSIDQEGTGNGFDIEITNRVSESVNIPVIAHGGSKDYLDIAKVINEAGASAVALASMLHYGVLKDLNYNISDITEREGNTAYLKDIKQFKSFGPNNIQMIKQQLQGIVDTRIQN